MQTLPKHGDKDRGILRYLNFNSLGFKPQRFFFITDVPARQTRGGHGHFKDRQHLFCVKGKIFITLYTSSGEQKFVLEEGDSCFMDRMVWSEQTYMTGEDVLLVVCSNEYDPEDYFYDKKQVYDEKLLHSS